MGTWHTVAHAASPAGMTATANRATTTIDLDPALTHVSWVRVVVPPCVPLAIAEVEVFTTQAPNTALHKAPVVSSTFDAFDARETAWTAAGAPTATDGDCWHPDATACAGTPNGGWLPQRCGTGSASDYGDDAAPEWLALPLRLVQSDAQVESVTIQFVLPPASYNSTASTGAFDPFTVALQVMYTAAPAAVVTSWGGGSVVRRSGTGVQAASKGWHATPNWVVGSAALLALATPTLPTQYQGDAASMWVHDSSLELWLLPLSVYAGEGTYAAVVVAALAHPALVVSLLPPHPSDPFVVRALVASGAASMAAVASPVRIGEWAHLVIANTTSPISGAPCMCVSTRLRTHRAHGCGVVCVR